MLKFIKRLLLAFSLAIVLLLCVQIFLFARILSGSRPIAAADVVVAFEGGEGRAQAAYQLADEGFAAHIVISPANRQRLARYDQQFKPARKVYKIIEEKARTTFENALLTSKIIKDNGFNSVILVTSWDHMPRSYLLLKMMLIGSGIQFHPHYEPTAKLNIENWYRHTTGWKMVYNEMLQFWGSLLELSNYMLKRELPDQVPGDSGIVQHLKEILLLKSIPIILLVTRRVSLFATSLCLP